MSQHKADDLTAERAATDMYNRLFSVMRLPEHEHHAKARLKLFYQVTRQEALREAEPLLLRLDNALTDWLRCYAPEEFTDEQLAETRARLHGGTLAYIAELRRDIKVGLARLASEGE